MGMGVDWADAERASKATGGNPEAATQMVFEGAALPLLSLLLNSL